MIPDYATRARALIGTPFRPQGRGEDGVDCVGLIVATFDIPTGRVRRDYRLRGDHRAEIEAVAGEWFRRVPKASARPGDALLLGIATDQMHLAIRTERGFVHADAALRRVVETPGEPPWPVCVVLRRCRRKRSR